MLEKEGIKPAVFSFSTVKPIDVSTIEVVAKSVDTIVTVEEHNIVGGFGSAVAEVIAEIEGLKAQLLMIGINDKYSSVVGSQKYIRDFYGINANKIIEIFKARKNG